MIGRRQALIGGSLSLAGVSAVSAGWSAESPQVPIVNMGPPPSKVPYTPIDQIPNHRQFMREIIIPLSAYAKQRKPGFIVLARNAPELLAKGPREWNWETIRDPDGYAANKYPPIGTVNYPYLRSIDGMLIDGLFYGRSAYDSATSAKDAKPLFAAMDLLGHEKKQILTIEYCKRPEMVKDALKQAAARHTFTYVDEEGDKGLRRIPAARPANENPVSVVRLDRAKNFLPVLDGTGFSSRSDWVNAMAETNYDTLIMNVFWGDADSLNAADVDTLKHKRMGTDRLVLATLPIGRAREGRFYWKNEWQIGNPAFLDGRDPDNQADIMVRYWDKDWKTIIGRYMAGIMDLGFDGVLFEGIDTYLYYEALFPIQ